jgi:uncharacterized protein (TIGR02145 family)
MKLKVLFFGNLILIMFFFLVGCKKDNQNNLSKGDWLNPNLSYGSLTDQEGNNYSTLIIGNKEWMAENLRTTKYCNGDPIPNVIDYTEWSNLSAGALSDVYSQQQFEIPYGKFYNWYAVNDSRNICPCGWHVPTEEEWNTLINLIDSNTNGGMNIPNLAGAKMKSIGTKYWLSPNEGANNESGFSGLPAGNRASNGTFGLKESNGLWWSSTESDTVSAILLNLNYYNSNISKLTFSKKFGLSVRCVKD